MSTTYVLGAGAIGFPLAAFLADAGRPVVAVRTSRSDVDEQMVTVDVHGAGGRLSARVRTVSLARLERLDGMVVVTTKAHVNEALAVEVKRRSPAGPVVILQNGLGVERPFLEAGLGAVYRCVLYATGQARSEYAFTFRPVTQSRVGIVEGDEAGLAACVERLSTDRFPFRPEPDIQREVWKKTVINAVFNSICPLLEVDNGVFVRDAGVADLAREVVRECLSVTDRLGLGLSEEELMRQLLLISETSAGQLISTLQDLRAGRPTEIDALNLEIARAAASLGIEVPRTALLGRMIVAKVAQRGTPD